ncbi:sugar phosphate isomerase/epimerase family protein [Chromobacterium subtsugae]|uniref:sugar phosphate isomerase/epimerase family protein n=1 Tax=Chromobacterium subtsugae TaxID=251747 RepID=UPI0006411704|nr:sugar phosphate isomerase/epimerase family protein [Chromobacterium subtsugae]
MLNNFSYPGLPFCGGVAHQKYLSAEKGIEAAHAGGCSHWYVDGSLIGEMVGDWDEARVDNLKKLIRETGVQPIFHGNFKAPLGSDVEDFRAAAVCYVKKEVDIASKLGAPLIIHGGGIVEPKMIVQAKKNALNNYLKSIVELAEYAAERSVDLYLENLSNYKNYRPFHYVYTNEEEYDYILGNLPDFKNVFLFLDAGHANVGDGKPAEVIRKYHHLIKGISFSNNNGMQDQHFGINDGTLDYKELISAIEQTGWKGLVAFETRNQSTETSLKELVALREVVAEQEDTACV